MKEKLPQLQIVSLNSLVLHEEPQIKRIKDLKKKIKRGDVYTNPIIVSKISKNKYLVLDGVHRVMAFKELGFSDIPVQIVNYFDPNLKIITWNHALTKIKKNDFLKTISQSGLKLEKININKALRLLNQRKILCTLEFDDRTSYIVIVESPFKLETFVKNLVQFSYLYVDRTNFYRVTKNKLRELKKDYRNVKLLINLPRFTRPEITKIARNNLTLCAGITRHIIPVRALKLEIPFKILKSKISLKKKNNWFKRFIEKKILNKEVRIYSEATVIYNE